MTNFRCKLLVTFFLIFHKINLSPAPEQGLFLCPFLTRPYSVRKLLRLQRRTKSKHRKIKIMSQVDIQTDTDGRIIGLSGNFTKWTNSNGDEDHFAPDAVTITVPEDMEAHVSATMTVDDWGYIDITPLSGGGSTIRAINLTTEVARPGPRGGHVRWSGQSNEAIVLQPGQYSIIIRQDTAPYDEAYANEAGTNVSFCQASVTIEYVAIRAPKKNLLSRSRAIALLDAYTKYNYNQENCPYAEDVWEKVGGELFQLHTTKPEYYYNKCALRVSLAL